MTKPAVYIETEASGGEEEAARERSAFLRRIPRLGVTDEAGGTRGQSSWKATLFPVEPPRTHFTSRSLRSTE